MFRWQFLICCDSKSYDHPFATDVAQPRLVDYSIGGPFANGPRLRRWSIEVLRDPAIAEGESSPPYSSVKAYRKGDSIAPLTASSAVRVENLL